MVSAPVCVCVLRDARTHAIQAEVEETLKRIQAHKGVMGIVIINSDGASARADGRRRWCTSG